MILLNRTFLDRTNNLDKVFNLHGREVTALASKKKSTENN